MNIELQRIWMERSHHAARHPRHRRGGVPRRPRRGDAGRPGRIVGIVDVPFSRPRDGALPRRRVPRRRAPEIAGAARRLRAWTRARHQRRSTALICPRSWLLWEIAGRLRARRRRARCRRRAPSSPGSGSTGPTIRPTSPATVGCRSSASSSATWSRLLAGILFVLFPVGVAPGARPQRRDLRAAADRHLADPRPDLPGLRPASCWPRIGCYFVTMTATVVGLTRPTRGPSMWSAPMAAANGRHALVQGAARCRRSSPASASPRPTPCSARSSPSSAAAGAGGSASICSARSAGPNPTGSGASASSRRRSPGSPTPSCTRRQRRHRAAAR